MEERRDAVRRRALIAAPGLFIAAVLAAGVAEACEPPRDFAPRARIESAGVAVMFRTVPPAIEIGRHFSVEAIVCADASSPVLTRVDADMPEHRHGMNYRATLTEKGAGRYVAEGFLFHMPGRWQLLFDVEQAGRRTRLTSDVLLE